MFNNPICSDHTDPSDSDRAVRTDSLLSITLPSGQQVHVRGVLPVSGEDEAALCRLHALGPAVAAERMFAGLSGKAGAEMNVCDPCATRVRDYIATLRALLGECS